MLQEVILRAADFAIAAAERLRQMVCALGGHDLAFHFEPGHVSLHCLNCGHHTPGWTIKSTVPAATRAYTASRSYTASRHAVHELA